MKTVHSFHDLTILQSAGAAWLQEDGSQILDESGQKIALETENGKANRKTSQLTEGTEVSGIESFLIAHRLDGGDYETRRITFQQLFDVTDGLVETVPLHSDCVLLVSDGQAYGNPIRKVATISTDSHAAYQKTWGVLGAGNRSYHAGAIGAVSVNNDGTLGALAHVATTAVAGAAIQTNAMGGFLLERNPSFTLKGRHNTNNETGCDFFFGLTGTTAANLLDSGTHLENYIGLQFRGSRGDTTYQMAICDGTNVTIQDTGVVPVWSSGSAVDLSLWYSTQTESVHFQVNQTLIGEFTGPFPEPDADLRVGLAMKALTATTRGYFVETLSYTRDKLWVFEQNGSIPGTYAGYDTFETYEEGTVTGTTVLNGGTNWGGPWVVNDSTSDTTTTRLLMGFDGTNGSTDFIDESAYERVMTVFGDAHFDTSEFLFITSAGRFDGTGDYLTTPNVTSFNLNTPFTVETWVRFNGLPAGAQYIASKSNASYTQGFVLGVSTATSPPRFFGQVGTGAGEVSLAGPAGIEADTWYHVALSYDGTTLRLFVDGVLVDSDTASPSNSTVAFYIGRDPNVTTRNLNGWLDEFRFSSACRYTADFTPSGPFARY